MSRSTADNMSLMPSRNVRAALACVTVLMLAGHVSAQAPGSANYARARAWFHEATIAYNSADYPRARSLFENAHQLEPGAATWRALALCDYRLECYPCAERELRAALAEPRPARMLSDSQQREALSLLKRLEARPDQTNTSDGIALEASVPEHGDPEPPPPQRPNRWRDTIEQRRSTGKTRAVIGLSAGGLALAVGAVAGTVSIVATRDELARCVDTRCPAERAGAHQRANTLANVANVSLGIAALGIAYGLFELLTLPAPDPRRALVAPTGTGVAVHVPL